jgi:membrane protein
MMTMSRRLPAWMARARDEWMSPMLRGISRARTLGLAAEMSFWLFLSLVPLAAVAGLIAARVATTRGAMTGGLLSTVPSAARNLIENEVQHVAAWHGSTVAPLAVAMFLWLAGSGIHSVFDALEVQAGTSRPWWRQRLLSLATCAALSTGVALLGLLAVGLGWLETLAGKAIPLAGFGASITGLALRAAGGVVVGVTMVAGLYRVGIPREARARIPIFPGATLAVLLVACLGWGYGVYVSTTGTGDAYQGSLAVIGVTLMTLWLFSVALLLGTELNKLIGNRRSGHSTASATGRSPSSGEIWPTSDASSCPQTSPTPPIEPSTGRSPLQHGSARP